MNELGRRSCPTLGLQYSPQVSIWRPELYPPTSVSPRTQFSLMQEKQIEGKKIILAKSQKLSHQTGRAILSQARWIFPSALSPSPDLTRILSKHYGKCARPSVSWVSKTCKTLAMNSDKNMESMERLSFLLESCWVRPGAIPQIGMLQETGLKCP